MIRFNRIIALLLSVLVISGISLKQVEAANNVNQDIEKISCVTTAFDFGEKIVAGARATTFSDTTIDASCSSAGLSISITTSMTKVASVVGVKDITVDRLINGEWVTVATANGGEVYNTIGCVVNFTYAQAVYNATYRVTCVHYANVDGYRELYHETESMKFIY